VNFKLSITLSTVFVQTIQRVLVTVEVRRYFQKTTMPTSYLDCCEAKGNDVSRRNGRAERHRSRRIDFYVTVLCNEQFNFYIWAAVNDVLCGTGLKERKTNAVMVYKNKRQTRGWKRFLTTTVFRPTWRVRFGVYAEIILFASKNNRNSSTIIS